MLNKHEGTRSDSFYACYPCARSSAVLRAAPSSFPERTASHRFHLGEKEEEFQLLQVLDGLYDVAHRSPKAVQRDADDGVTSARVRENVVQAGSVSPRTRDCVLEIRVTPASSRASRCWSVVCFDALTRAYSITWALLSHSKTSGIWVSIKPTQVSAGERHF